MALNYHLTMVVESTWYCCRTTRFSRRLGRRDQRIWVTKSSWRPVDENVRDVPFHSLPEQMHIHTSMVDHIPNSKLFPSLVLGTPAEEPNSTLQWNTKVADVLGDSRRLQDSEAGKAANLVDILSHRTWFPSHDFGWRKNPKML